MLNGLPIYKAVLDDEVSMYCISLVDFPAVEKNFIAFKENKVMKFNVQDEEQHIVFGVVMKADTPIYRYSPDYGEFYMMFDKETIKRMAEQYLVNGFQNNVNLDHNPDNYVEGVNMLEWFIKDEAKGISPVGFEDVTDGSLFASFKVNNEDVWNSIKEGTFKGFSLEGMFGLAPENFKKINNENKILKMANNKIAKIKAMLKNILLAFNEISTDKGVLRWNGEETDELPKVGDNVYVVIDENETENPAEDGTYIVDDKISIVVENGSVSEVIIKEDEVVEEVETEFSKKCREKFESYEEREAKLYEAVKNQKGVEGWLVEAGEDYVVISIWGNEGEMHFRYPYTISEDGEITVGDGEEVKQEYVPVEDEAQVEEAIAVADEERTEETFEEQEKPADEEVKTLETFKARVAELEKENEALKSEIESLKNKPAADSVVTEYERMSRVIKTSDEKLNNVLRIASAR